MPHSLTLFEDEDVLCLSDREGKKIDCVRAGLNRPQFANVDETGNEVVTYTGVGKTYAIDSIGKTRRLYYLLTKRNVTRKLKTYTFNCGKS